MTKPILKNCPHCGGEISFRVFADKRRKHTKYVLSVKCEDCKTVTTICTKERGGAAFAALADKWNARSDGRVYAPGGVVVEHVNCRCVLPAEKEINGIMLKRCTKCGQFPAGFNIRDCGNGSVESTVICDCGAESMVFLGESYIEIDEKYIRVLQKNAAALWNTKGARV